ncbi:MAG: hypothetical protein WCX81_01785 [Monoglobales bacterium]
MKEIGMSDNRDIVKEAQMIIDSFAVKMPSYRRSRKKTKSSEKTLWFFAGIATSAAMFLAIFLKIY